LKLKFKRRGAYTDFLATIGKETKEFTLRKNEGAIVIQLFVACDKEFIRLDKKIKKEAKPK